MFQNFPIDMDPLMLNIRIRKINEENHKYIVPYTKH